MRSGKLALLSAVMLSLGTLIPATAAPDDAARPNQYRIRVEHVLFKGELFPKDTTPAVNELREKGWVADDTTTALKRSLAAAIAAGRASVTDVVTIATLEGVGAQLEVAGKELPGLGASFVPHAAEGKVQLDLKLVYGTRVDGRLSGQTVEQQVTVSSGGQVAVRLPGTKELPAEPVVFLRVPRVDP